MKILLIAILFSFGCAEEKRAPAKTEKPVVKVLTRNKALLPYKIVEKEDVSYAGTSRLVVRVMVEIEKLPNKDELTRIANTIWNNGNTRWAEFTVFLYLPEMNTHSIAYGVGEFRPSGLKEFTIHDYALYDTKWSEPEP